MRETQLEDAFDDYFAELLMREEYARYSDVEIAKQAFAAGVDFATKRHIKDIKKMKETI